MSLGLFDVVGPIMHGPSSNHTGGANRIGFAASEIIGGQAASYEFLFNPIFFRMFTGHRTNVAMMAGCLGIREYEDDCNESLELAASKGIAVSYHPIVDEEVDRNTMRIRTAFDGIDWEVSAISVGGGSILIDRINHVPLEWDGNRHLYVFVLENVSDPEKLLDEIRSLDPGLRMSGGNSAPHTDTPPKSHDTRTVDENFAAEGAPHTDTPPKSRGTCTGDENTAAEDTPHTDAPPKSPGACTGDENTAAEGATYTLVFLESPEPLSGRLETAVRDALAGVHPLPTDEPAAPPRLIAARHVHPVTPFSAIPGREALFSSFDRLLELCEDRSIVDVVIDYECHRTGCGRRDVLDMGHDIVDTIEASMARGLAGNNALLAGFCSGSDGKMMLDWKDSPRSIVGGVFADAMAGALAMAEVSASAGRIVAVPTSGSAGGLPGTLFAVAKRFGSSKQELVHAFLVSAAVGAIIGNSCSFSGSIGGCQSEIGIGAGMAAAGACYLAGGSPESMVHATALAIKNTLGLICDPLAPPVEIPCIKRNAFGASTALMAAEMALAGIRSAVPPDEVVIALRDTQMRLPTELKGACVGGLAAAPCARTYQARWQEKLSQPHTV
ncbi:MAG: L-serine ammonia-lyase, iron-sulfur-dependent, subunit alpha [Lachnospiraceae bacterium]|jgi:L-serine dehydratase|nr:L-serine ammonia-lyase, iron-sulfur-dependent, subunit alpha [Lachnospiraceae bacterium]